MADPVAIVGASLGGLRAAEQLRAAGYAGPITVFGAERHPPYNRPPLSKEVLADSQLVDADSIAARLAFRARASVADVEFRLGTTVTAVSAADRTLSFDGPDGPGEAAYAGLVLATGLRPRRLDVPGPSAGRLVIRTIDDCLGLKAALGARSRVVVVGGGFIGCETACTLADLGHDVTVVEPTGAPMNRVLGAELAEAVQQHHERAHHERSPVSFVIGPGVEGFAAGDDGGVAGVRLSDGSELPADVVVESVGSQCNTEFLAGNDLDLTDGVLTRNDLSVVGADGWVAVGDIARFPNPVFDDVPRRVEHWSMPTDTAKRAARTLAAHLGAAAPDPTPFAPIPSFWSDQGALRFQSFGSPALADDVRIVEGSPADLVGGVLATYHRADALVGIVAVNLPPARQRPLRDDFVARAMAR